MYSDYFDDPSGAMRDDENNFDDTMEDIETDESSSDNEDMIADELNTKEDVDNDDGPKSTLEKQQEKVSHSPMLNVQGFCNKLKEINS